MFVVLAIAYIYILILIYHFLFFSLANVPYLNPSRSVLQKRPIYMLRIPLNKWNKHNRSNFFFFTNIFWNTKKNHEKNQHYHGKCRLYRIIISETNYKNKKKNILLELFFQLNIIKYSQYTQYELICEMIIHFNCEITKKFRKLNFKKKKLKLLIKMDCAEQKLGPFHTGNIYF